MALTDRTRITLAGVEGCLGEKECVSPFTGYNGLVSGPEAVFVAVNSLDGSAILGGRSLLFELGKGNPRASLQVPNDDFGSSSTGIVTISPNQDWIVAPSAAVLSGFGWYRTNAAGGPSQVQRFDETFELEDVLGPVSFRSDLDGADRTELARQFGPPRLQAISRLQFTPDGKQLLVSGGEVTVIRDTANWQIERKLVHPSHNGVSFWLGGGTHVLRIGWDLRHRSPSRTVVLADARTGQAIHATQALAGMSDPQVLNFIPSQNAQFVAVERGLDRGCWVYGVDHDTPVAVTMGQVAFSAKQIFELRDGALWKHEALSDSGIKVIQLPVAIPAGTRVTHSVSASGKKGVIRVGESKLVLWTEGKNPIVQDMGLKGFELFEVNLSPSGDTVQLIYAEVKGDHVGRTTMRLYHFGT